MVKNEVKISVRRLVEYIERTGDIDNRSLGSSSIRAVEGTKAHQKVQRSYGEGYSPEFSLKYSTYYEGLQLAIEGRADGVLVTKETIVIDEIKSTMKELDGVSGENPLHWGQVKCYGYIYCHQKGLEEISLQLTYYNIVTENIKKIVKKYSKNELKNYFYGLIEKYTTWIKLLNQWELTRNTSIKNLQFPFSNYRKGQRELAVSVYKTIQDKKRGFFQAPTGIGKTISTLFPTVKAMGEEVVDKIFYLTAKTITRQVAEEAVSKMAKKGMKLKTITLTAKDKICFMDETKCNPDYCPYAEGHFDRVNTAVLAILQNENIVKRETIQRFAKEYRVCPFELALDVAVWSDCVIGDYNYAFDPRVYLKRFFDESCNNYVFLVDEAHNLLDRAREMFSSDLNKKEFLEMKKYMKEKNNTIAKTLNKINSYFVSKKKLLGDKGNLVEPEEPKDLYPLISAFVAVTEAWLQEENEENELIDLFFRCHQFLKISEFYGENFVTYTEKVKDDIRLKIFCLDPAKHLKEAMGRSISTILFSATLTPLTFYKDVLGGTDNDNLLSLASPFDPKNLKVFVAKNISTYYKDREKSYESISDMLYQLIHGKVGNYFAFFPSYKYMNNVYHFFTGKYPDVMTLIQEAHMPEENRESFLREFMPNPNKTLLAFAVMGGVFSEGIDLIGERLIGTALVGVGLPQLSLERDLIAQYYDKDNKGYEYSYMYPGLSKVLQSAGRVIRKENDKGVVLLIDKRYKDFRYQKLLPKNWTETRYILTIKDLEINLSKFWTVSHG